MIAKIKYLVFVLPFVVLFLACKSETKEPKETPAMTADSLLSVRFENLLKHPLDSIGFPRSYSLAKAEVNKVPSRDWTSGFFPGNLWHVYQLTGNPDFKNRAAQWTSFIEKEKFNDGTHDMGFKVYCSFGQGTKVEQTETYEKIIVESAKTLSTRFNKNVGSLRSWDFNKDIWEFPVIIDNMMNLELLFEATRISGDSTFHDIAVSHANTTLKNHFRKNNSSYHVVVYDTINGAVKDKVTHQGFDASSAWARGQAWGIYGYTMSYRYTNDIAYLNQAKASLAFYLDHPNMREDGIPFWDFNDPAIPMAVRDVSAATIVASACYELYGYDKNPEYKTYADKVLKTLMSKKYLLEPEVEAPFILKHSTGNWPKKDEIDEPIVYGDYYFLEALLRQKNL
ncbi:glucuronyl hydrolase [Croceivirga lutea]|nr:glucuronyl hydrolase [Croceivirga lutea]